MIFHGAGNEISYLSNLGINVSKLVVDTTLLAGTIDDGIVIERIVLQVTIKFFKY
jgi:hypothetical protein